MRMEIDMKNFIENRIPELKNNIYPVFTTKINKLTVAYSFTHLSGGHLKESQLELKIIGKYYEKCKEIEDKINQILDMEEDNKYLNAGNTRFHSGLAGGGCLFNSSCQMWEDTLIYIIDWRSI